MNRDSLPRGTASRVQWIAGCEENGHLWERGYRDRILVVGSLTGLHDLKDDDARGHGGEPTP